MWHVLYLYYDYAVSVTVLSVQLNVYATNCMAKCVHANVG